MSVLSISLPRLSERADTESWRPCLLSGDQEAAALVGAGRVTSIHDRLTEQLTELARCRDPRNPVYPAGVRGVWVWYPWSGRLVRVLPRAEFRQVRTDRNRDKITRLQQAGLLDRRIGIVGLSVGNCVALTCAMEGVGGTFRLADFDRVGLANLNRLRSGVHELGLEKTVLCARQMYEIDPYLDIEISRGGLDEGTIEEFFGHGLDLLVEESDTPWVKVAAREHARRQGIPVLMDCNDRGMLDVERFDLEPARPLLHGRIGDTTSAQVRHLRGRDAAEFLLQIADSSQISMQMATAIDQIGRTLSSWPQLASGVGLGGALVTDTARRVLLGHPVPSGRYYVDLERLIPSVVRR